MYYEHVAKVTGFLPFPIDMLRYDYCFPVTEDDSRKIMETLNPDIRAHQTENWTIFVKTATTSKHPLWTVGRWESFGWEIGFVESRRI